MSAEGGNLRRRRLRFLKRRKTRERDAAMTVREHLRELRRRLVVSAAAFLAVSVFAFFFYNQISAFLREPFCSLPRRLLGPLGCNLVQSGILEGFQVRLKLTAMTGMVLSSPVWLYQLWAFIVPGLTERERRYTVPFVASSLGLFMVGATFAYLTLPRGLNFLIGIGGDGLVPFFRADSYLNFVGLMIIIFGLTFELPLILLFLGLAEVVSVEFLRTHRRAAVVLITLLAAVVTPSQDPYTMLAMGIPLYGMYELAILILRVVARKRSSRPREG